METPRINDDVYMELKLLAASGQTCTLQFRADNGGIATTDTNITDVFADETGQYLIAGNGLTLQLHQLLAVNGKALEQWC